MVTRTTSRDGVVAPTQDDPLVAHLSERAGGPAGRRLRSSGSGTPAEPSGAAAPSDGSPRAAARFWSIPRILVAMTVAMILLSALSMQWCRVNGWAGDGMNLHGCYSDVAALYPARELDQNPWAPFSGEHWFEYPVLTGLVAVVAALITHGLDALSVGYWGARTELLHWDISFLFTAVVWIVLVLTVMRTAGRDAGPSARHRPWDAAIVALSPAILFGAGINWDLWATASLALAVLLHVRGRHLGAGVMVGVGVSFKIFPLFLLGAVLVLALRHELSRRGMLGGRASSGRIGLREFGLTAAGAVGSWLLINLPAMLASWDSWQQFYSFSAGRGAGNSSIWHVWLLADGQGLSADQVSFWSFTLFLMSCLSVLALGLFAPEEPRVAQLLLLIVAAFMVFNKVYSPQFMIWLVPLIALARPRWRDALIWQAFQVLHFWAIWMYFLGQQPEAVPQHTVGEGVFILAVIAQFAATGYLMLQVVLDVWRPGRDVLRAGVVEACPAGRSGEL